MAKNLLTLFDLTPTEIDGLFERAAWLKVTLHQPNRRVIVGYTGSPRR